jgi:lysophospholipase L1-like esterase
MFYSPTLSEAERAARKAAKKVAEIKAMEIAPEFYERLRDIRGYLPDWKDLTGKQRREIAKTASQVSALENAIAGNIYRASKIA